MKNSLFDLSNGNKIRLYSNAYDNVPGAPRHSRGLHADMFRELNAANAHICIVGWAISPTEKFGEHDDTLPELLVRKAKEGVNVVVLVWNNIVRMYNLEHKKILQAVEAEIAKLTTEEQDTVRQNLHIKFSPRELGFTDHQKMVVVDTALYIGGIDLVPGRSDPDLYHDTHARVEGDLVRHALRLIHARWDGVKQDAVQDQIVSQQLEIMRNTIEVMNYINEEQLQTDPENTMQLLCSVREDFWGKGHKWIDVTGKKHHTEEIHEEYIAAINRAEKFIYMENQFFIGNRLHANRRDTVKSSNKVIEAIVKKIIDKINCGEEFHFYCQIPYRPEGSEKAVDVVIISRKQWRTIAWVIRAVDEAARAFGKSAADYLTFYNLGQVVRGKYEMKYTHSKLMIVDDKELILGSANCNERSMAGNRDSEVAVHVRGYSQEIMNYRERLLCEHFGDEYISANAEIFMLHPEKKVCSLLLHHRLDNNLEKLGKEKAPVATPWGNIPYKELMQREKPPHIPHRSPLPFSLLMGAVNWARKMPL